MFKQIIAFAVVISVLGVGVSFAEQACPAVCVPMWALGTNSCSYDTCGSGCGPNNVTTFPTEVECTAKIGAYFKIVDNPYNDTFVIKITNPDKITQARSILNGQTNGIVVGKVIKEQASYNKPWSFFLDPGTIEFPETTIEVCQSTVRYTQEHLSDACGAFLPDCQLCLTGAKIVAEIKPEVPVTCADSDGLNYYTRGYAKTSNGSVLYDQCSSERVLNEATCKENTPVYVNYECDLGCAEGVCRKPVPNTTSLYVGTDSDLKAYVGHDFIATFYVKGGTEPYSWGMEGSLPPGLELVRSGRQCTTTPCPQFAISDETNYVYVKGTPTQAGQFKFRLIAKDASGLMGGETFVITVMGGDTGGTITVRLGEKFQLAQGGSAILGDTGITMILKDMMQMCTVSTYPAGSGGSGGPQDVYSTGVAQVATGRITGDNRVCPDVCTPMFELQQVQCIREPCYPICRYDACGSGCGPDYVTTFPTEEKCNLARNSAVVKPEPVCPAVCKPMWKIGQAPAPDGSLRDIPACIFNECGSGCGPDNIHTFSTEVECKAKITSTCPSVVMPMCVQGSGIVKSVDSNGCVYVSCAPIKECTADARVCPDGTTVGRTGPNCEFAPCGENSCRGYAVVKLTRGDASADVKLMQGSNTVGGLKIEFYPMGDKGTFIVYGNDVKPVGRIYTEKTRYLIGERVRILANIGGLSNIDPHSDVRAIVTKPDGTRDSVTLLPVSRPTDVATGISVSTGGIVGSSAGYAVSGVVSSDEAKPGVYYNGAMFEGFYENTNVQGDYKVMLESNVALASDGYKFTVVDKSLLEKYLILSNIGDYVFQTADFMKHDVQGYGVVGYIAGYLSSDTNVIASVIEMPGRDDVRNLMNKLKSQGSSLGEQEINGNKVLVFSPGNAMTAAIWTHDNLIIYVMGSGMMTTSGGGFGGFTQARSEATAVSNVVTGKMTDVNQVGAVNQIGVDRPEPTLINYPQPVPNVVLPRAVVESYLNKFPSTLGEATQPPKDVDSNELIDVAFRLENLKQKFDKLQRNANALADYYGKVNDTEQQTKFTKVGDMFGTAKSMIESIKAKIASNADNTGVIDELRDDFKELKTYIKSILLFMLGLDEEDLG